MRISIRCGILASLLFFWLGVEPTKAVEPSFLSQAPYSHEEEWKAYYQPGLCGPIALFGVCRYYGVSTSIDDLAQLSEYNGRGVTIRGLVMAADRKKLEPSALNSSVAHLKRIQGPAIIDYPKGHFCIFLGWIDGKARLLDPPLPIHEITPDELERSWGKHAITFSRALRAKSR